MRTQVEQFPDVAKVRGWVSSVGIGIECGGLNHRPRLSTPAVGLEEEQATAPMRRGSRSEPRDAGQARHQFAIDVERAFRSSGFSVKLQRGEAR